MRVSILCVLLTMGCVVPVCLAGPAQQAAVNAGETIYRDGVLGSGKPLVAQREGGLQMQGADAACVNCHRRSGFGMTEGRISVPPVAGQYLFTSDYRDLPYVETMRAKRKSSYTEASLARAIREGVDAAGRSFDYLMPRFALNDDDMAALIDYLKGLDQHRVRGVSDTVLHFATIVTPDADPVKRDGMLNVLQRYFDDKNAVPLGPTPRLSTSRKLRFMVNRRWQLHVWQLSGAADTWQEQLKNHLAKEPVFAVVSGIGGENWAPVHDFCEHQALPCLFPNVEAPPAGADGDFYSLYFSKGVLLEAGLMARKILDAKPANGATVTQIYRAGDSGEAGARALAAVLRPQGIKVRSRALSASAKDHDITTALDQAAGTEILVLWLRPADIATLGPAPAASTAVYLSGLMGGLERAPLPEAWRGRVQVAYPFDLPDKRIVGVDFALGWFRIRSIPVVAPRVQSDTYLAIGLLSETLSRMVDTFVPDYLIERMEDMLDHRIITGYYPRLALATGQRFASKGGYMVRFPEPKGTRVIADSGWIVP